MKAFSDDTLAARDCYPEHVYSLGTAAESLTTSLNKEDAVEFHLFEISVDAGFIEFEI